MSHEHQSTEQQMTTLEQTSDPELEKAAETLDAIEDHVKETNPNATPEDVDETVAGFVDAADQTNDDVVESDAANVGVVEMANNPSAWHTALAFVKLPIEKVANVLRKLSPEKADEVTATIDAAEHDARPVASERQHKPTLDRLGTNEKNHSINDTVPLLANTFDAVRSGQKISRIEDVSSWSQSSVQYTRESIVDGNGAFLTHNYKSKTKLGELRQLIAQGVLSEQDTSRVLQTVNDVAALEEGQYIKGPGHESKQKMRQTVLDELLAVQQQILEEHAHTQEGGMGAGDSSRALRTIRFARGLTSDAELGRFVPQISNRYKDNLGIEDPDQVLAWSVSSAMTVRPYHEVEPSGDLLSHTMSTFEQMSSDGIGRKELAKSGVSVGEHIAGIRRVAEKVGMNLEGFDAMIVANISHDLADAVDMCETALEHCETDESRQKILKLAARALVVNGHNERTRRFAQQHNLDPASLGLFNDTFDVEHYKVNNVGRTLDQSFAMVELMRGTEGIDAERRLVVLDAVDALYEQRIRGSVGDVLDIESVRRMTGVVQEGLGGTERVRAVSLVVDSYAIAEHAPVEIVSALERRRGFVPLADEAGNLHPETVDELVSLDQVVETLAATSEVDDEAMRFIVADMTAAVIEQLSTNDNPTARSQAEGLLQRLGNSRQTVGALLKFRQSVMNDRAEYLRATADTSDDKTTEYYLWAMKKSPEAFGVVTDQIHDTIVAEAERIKDTIGVSINLSPESLSAVMLEPPYRFKSVFEVSNRDAAYDLMRTKEEAAMGIRVASAMIIDEQPIYGAVTSENGRDEILGGAPGGYGNIFVTLDNNRIRDRTVVVPRDSFYSPTADMRVSFDHAAEIVAVNNLTNAKYAEAQVLGGVSVADIKSITIDSSMVKQMTTMLAKVQELYPGITIQFVDSTHVPKRKQDPRRVEGAVVG